MLFKILLVVLPALALARINIKLTAGKNENLANVEILGSNVDIITDKERSTWQIGGDNEIKAAAEKLSGGWPTDVYVKSPTPWGDLYKSYGWDQVQRTLTPRNARILGIHSEPVIVTSQEFINNSSVKATYNAGISQQVETSFGTKWSKGGELEIGQEIEYCVEFGAGSVGGTSSISYTSSWGEETEKTEKVTIGSTSGVTIELNPGQAVLAVLSATRGTMEVLVDYTATLSGYIACNYKKTYKGHHFWAYDVNDCLDAVGKPLTVDSTEVIKIGFYSDAKVEVKDKKTGRSKREWNIPAGVSRKRREFLPYPNLPKDFVDDAMKELANMD